MRQTEALSEEALSKDELIHLPHRTEPAQCLPRRGRLWSAAFEMCDRAEKANPTSNDAMYGPLAAEILARVTAGAGESDRAIDAIEKLRTVPYRGPLVWVRPLTVALLRLDPMFDSLSDNPRFQRLTAGMETK